MQICHGGFVVITNDKDFLNLSWSVNKSPKIILLEVGNQSNDFIVKLLIERHALIESFVTNGEQKVLEITD